MTRPARRQAIYQNLAEWTGIALIFCAFPCVLTFTSSSARAAGPREELFELSAKGMSRATRRSALPTRWKFHPDDDPAFAAHKVNDAEWREVDTRLVGEDRPLDWSGIGWFRLRFRVDPDLQGQAMSLMLDQVGASEVYLDGEPLLTLGKIDPNPEKTIGRVQRQPHLFAFDARQEHVLAVRYCHHDPASFEAIGKAGGFRVTLGEANHRIEIYGQDLRSNNSYQAFFTGVFASFAVLHFLLFVFYREAAENLWFALLASCVALLVYVLLHVHTTTDPDFLQLSERAVGTLGLLLCVCALGFVYRVFGEGAWRIFHAVAVIAAILLVPGLLWPLESRLWVLALVLMTFLEMCRAVARALRKRKSGARIVGLGILVLVAGFTVGLLSVLKMVPTSIETLYLVPLYSMCFLVLSMSIHLSRKFARANRDLREQLLQVRELSEHKLQQARQNREDEVKRTRLEAEYQRKATELEEARQLQLSMLPEHLPELPDLELAANMRTATEVGGDYYDFDMADDGTLTLAIGDATGHGMRAGTMVTATKSLFKSLADEDQPPRSDPRSDLPKTLTRFTRAIKRMNLRQLSMALTLAKFKDSQLSLAAAGMPPALIYRARSKTVETLLMEGAPLGSLMGYPYRQIEVHLGPGDTVLLMSDGFPERLNHQDEMLGYDKATQAFEEVAATSPQSIIERLMAKGESWAQGRSAKDDTTFIVMKRREIIA